MFASIGFGKTNTDQIIQKLIKKHKDELPKKIEDLDINKVKPKKSFSNEVRVSDLDDQVDVKFAKCCNPVPGDQIVGYITKGNGISVHVRTCPNITSLKSPERLIDVYWQNNSDDMFPVRIQITTKDKTGIIFEITKLISTENVSIEAMNVRSNENHEGIIDLTVSVPNTEKLNELIMKLKTIKMIESIYRVKS